jgi:spermidine synthase
MEFTLETDEVECDVSGDYGRVLHLRSLWIPAKHEDHPRLDERIDEAINHIFKHANYNDFDLIEYDTENPPEKVDNLAKILRDNGFRAREQNERIIAHNHLVH